MKEFYDNESNRELKNDMLTSLLIKFVCRYLPYESKESQSKDLFEMLREKNMNLSDKILNELDEMKNNFGVKLKNAIDITMYFYKKRNLNKLKENDDKKIDKKDKNEINIELVHQEHGDDESDNEDEDDDDEEDNKAKKRKM